MKILAIDLSSVCRGAWELFQNGKLSDGEAKHSALDRIARARDGFDRVVVACDVGPSFRKLHCPTYKANRPDPGDAYRAMMRDVAERVVKDGATIFPNRTEQAVIAVKVPIDSTDPESGLRILYPEADDVIASLAAWYLRAPADSDAEQWQLRILSGDTDLWALVNDEWRIDVQSPTNGCNIATEKDVEARFGGVGAWVTEVKALAGDDGDGYSPFMHPTPPEPGKKEGPGIAVKTAIALLKKVPGKGATEVVELAHDEQSDLTPHIRKCLLTARGGGLAVGYACARMLTDLPLDFSRILAEPKIEPIAPKERVIKSAESPRVEVVSPRQLAKYAPPATDLLDSNALQPQSLSELEDIARMVVDSRMYEHIDSVPRAMLVIAEARERRVPFATALRASYFVGNKIAWYSYFIVGLVRRQRDVCEYFELEFSNFEKAIVVFKRVGRPERTFEYPIEEAARAGYIRKGKNGTPSRWETEPRTMLEWGAKRRCARAHFDDVVGGMYTPDELTTNRNPNIELDVLDGSLE